MRRFASLLAASAVLAGATAVRADTSIVWVENRNAIGCHPDCGFDLWRMAPDGGGARSTAARRTGNALWADWTRDGRRLVYVYKYTAGGNEATQLRVANADLSADREIAAERPGVRVTPEWLPDGRRIVFALYERGRVSGESELFTIAADGSDLRKLTSLPGDESEPSFSPDGKRVVFARSESISSGGPTYRPTEPPSIWSVATDGGQLRQHTRGDALVALHNIAYSPDGGRIAFVGGADGRIFVISTDGGPVRAVGARVSLQPSWSPDGEFLTFVRLGERPGEQALWRAPLDAGAGNGMALREGFQTGYGIDGADWISDAPWPSAEAADRRAPDVTLARFERRNGQIVRTAFGPSTSSTGRRRSIAVQRPDELGFVAVDRSGIGRLEAVIERRRRQARGSAADRVKIRSSADWRRLRGRLRRGTYELRFRSADVLGNATTSAKLVVRIGSR